MTLSGILNVNKPPGWTSFDVVRFVRGRGRQKRVGHAGTLDPAATGVLPVLIGHATRLTEYLVDATKAYEATIELGLTTDTYDADGQVLSRTDATAIKRDEIEQALRAFQGDILQVPPAYSAIKRDGVPLYTRARKGEDVTLEPRPVRVWQLDIIEYTAPVLRLHVECGKGFYVRSLAHDLGAALGVGGTLTALERSRVGTFRVEDAVDIETLRVELERGEWQERLYAPDEILLDWRAAILGPENETRLRQGQTARVKLLPGARLSDGDRCRAYGSGGDLIGILRADAAANLRPEKIFPL